MGLLGGYNEEEFLDPDEIRLRRESAARAKKAHKDCVADHSDDYNGHMAPANNTRPHNDCKADHRDDKAAAQKVFVLTAAILTLLIIMVVTIVLAVVFSN